MLPLWKATTRYKIAKGGRGSGKSYGIGQNFVVEALENRHRMLLTRDVQNTLSDSALAMLKRVIHDLNLDTFFRQTRHGLSCVNGTEFLFRGLQNPDRIKSLEGITRVWIEEGQNVAKSALDILIPTIREPGSEIWVSYNPDTEDDPIRSLENREATVVEVNYFDNPYFPDPLRREMEYDKATDYDKYLWIWKVSLAR